MSLFLEIKNLLTKNSKQWDDIVSDGWPSYKITPEYCEFLTLNGITIECVHQYGGEGKGDKYWKVFKFTKDNEIIHIRVDGWYQSYESVEWENNLDFYKVELKAVTREEWVGC